MSCTNVKKIINIPQKNNTIYTNITCTYELKHDEFVLVLVFSNIDDDDILFLEFKMCRLTLLIIRDDASHKFLNFHTLFCS